MSTKTILVVGGAGAQGSAVVHALAATRRFAVKVLTRNTSSSMAVELADLPGVSLIAGDASDVEDLRSAFQGVDACYVNTNGFALGEKQEIFWGIRTFEIAREAGVAHFVYAGLPYIYKKSGYDARYNAGHLDGKGRVSEFISAQPTSPMSWTVIESCFYMEMLNSPGFAPSKRSGGEREQDETYVFTSAIATGSMPMITLPDLAQYTLWVFEHPTEASGMKLRTASEHVNWDRLVEAFTRVTGKTAVHRDVTLDQFVSGMVEHLPDGRETRLGDATVKGDKTLMRMTDNFRAFFDIHRRAVPPSHGFWPVDYDLLDTIFPGRVRSAEEWMRKVGYTGDEKRAVLRTAA